MRYSIEQVQQGDIVDRSCDMNAYDKVLEVSVDLFLRNGFDKTTIRMILDGCNIHSGSLYYLYSNKEEILKGMIEAFYGDIMCRSGKHSRQNESTDMVLILPAAFMLHSASRSRNLARLLYQAHCSWPIMDKIVEMAVYWTDRDNITKSKENSLRSDFQFLTGGVGNMIGECYHSEERSNHRAMIERFSKAAFELTGMERPEDWNAFLNKICEIVESEGLEFIGRDIDSMDETYGSEGKEK